MFTAGLEDVLASALSEYIILGLSGLEATPNSEHPKCWKKRLSLLRRLQANWKMLRAAGTDDECSS